tara:strand:+ start:32 stop:415 length:384 start_codon:yes stop_codon:yes gene_type:complete
MATIKITSITILARKYQDASGNTYYANKIYVGGEGLPSGLLAYEPYAYGYGTQWLQDATDRLSQYLAPIYGDEGLNEMKYNPLNLAGFCDEHGIALVTDGAVVRTKKELKEWTITCDREIERRKQAA